MDPKVKQKIEKHIEKAPPLSASALKLLELSGDPDHSMHDVIAITESDAILTARILQIVNSAAMATSSPISTIDRAVMHAGERIVVTEALNLCTKQLFQKPLLGYQGEAKCLWRHCLYTAIAARHIAPFAKTKILGGEAFTAGIVHDIGKSIFSEILAEKRDNIIEDMVEDSDLDFLSAELSSTGLNHCAAGYLLANKWKLPESMAHVIAYHHQPTQAPKESRTLATVVHIADTLSMMQGITTGIDELKYNLDLGYIEYVDLPRQEFMLIMLDILEEFEETEAALA